MHRGNIGTRAFVAAANDLALFLADTGPARFVREGARLRSLRAAAAMALHGEGDPVRRDDAALAGECIGWLPMWQIFEGAPQAVVYMELEPRFSPNPPTLAPVQKERGTAHAFHAARQAEDLGIAARMA